MTMDWEPEGWARLTPADDSGLEIEPCYYQRLGPEPDVIHSFQGGRDALDLSNAEALAFARQLPEVKALAKALHTLEPEHVSGSLTFLGCTKCGATSNGRPLIHADECPFAALAPFEETPHARLP